MVESYRKSYVRCVVPSCLQERELGISFHKFPDKKRDKQRYRKWLNLLALDYHPHQHAVVCSRHFKISDFHHVKSSDQTKLILRKDVIPLSVTEPPVKETTELSKARSERAEARASKNQNACRSTDDVNLPPNTDEEVQISMQITTENAAVQVDTTDLDSLCQKKERKIIQFKTEQQFIAWTGLGNFEMLDVIAKAVDMIPEAETLAKWEISIKDLVTLVFVKSVLPMHFNYVRYNSENSIQILSCLRSHPR